MRKVGIAPTSPGAHGDSHTSAAPLTVSEGSGGTPSGRAASLLSAAAPIAPGLRNSLWTVRGSSEICARSFTSAGFASTRMRAGVHRGAPRSSNICHVEGHVVCHVEGHYDHDDNNSQRNNSDLQRVEAEVVRVAPRGEQASPQHPPQQQPALPPLPTMFPRVYSH